MRKYVKDFVILLSGQSYMLFKNMYMYKLDIDKNDILRQNKLKFKKTSSKLTENFINNNDSNNKTNSFVIITNRVSFI